ncbi:MAG: hypothetical protein IJL97_05160, partial [Lachnospiraceae bacterium]|nr:hypothetical protein [Lachnospiraceae bacterium]
FDELREIALSDKNYGTHVTKGMGAVVVVSGWVEGNIYGNGPIRGRLQAYVGTGFNAVGQYAILTWEITGQIGAEGSIDLSFIYDGMTDSYDVQVDNLRLGGTGSLEAYGGIGLAGVASIGIYGAASASIHFDIVPETDIADFIIAGQLGFKVKVLGKTIVNFRLISGSYDFVNKKVGNAGPIDLEAAEAELKTALLESDYGSMVIPTEESQEEMTWNGETDQPVLQLGSEWIGDADFSRKLASNITPHSKVQIINISDSVFPQMNVLFLADSQDRAAGNKSTLMNTYYDIGQGYMSDPIKIADDGTADFDPYAYHNSRSVRNYLVWTNAIKPLDDTMTLSEIADNTEIEFAEFQVGGDWNCVTRVTDFAGSGQYAAGAKVGSDRQAEPVVVYYTNDVSDPAGFAGTHGIYVAKRRDLWQWDNEKIAEFDGSITGVDTEWFRSGQHVAVSRTAPDGEKSLLLYKNGELIMERENACLGKFMERGFNYLILTWYENGRLWMMEDNGKVSAITPEDLYIPPAEYKLVGKSGSSGMMLIATSSKDSSSNIFALYSPNGGSKWVKLDLTNIDEFATIGDVSAAFTYDTDEPVLVYSQQNYVINYDNEITNAENFVEGRISEDRAVNISDRLLVGEEDERFTDTTCDLYIKARKANSHVSFVEGHPVNEEDARPGQFLDCDITIKNTGLYPVDKFYIMSRGWLAVTIEQRVEPGETATVRVQLPFPRYFGPDPVTIPVDVTQREDQVTESRGEVYVGTGHVEGEIEHLFENGQEKMAYTITNFGFAPKDITILVRDEKRNVTIAEEEISVNYDEVYRGEILAKDKLFVNSGCEDITLYIIPDGETEEHRIAFGEVMLSAEPLDAVYGREFVAALAATAVEDETTGSEEQVHETSEMIENTTVETETETPGEAPDNASEASDSGISPACIAGAVIAVIAAVIIILLVILKKKKAGKN